ncbi:unnamed protein product [Chironomus riparius]|uniref:Gustatory receptor n=1 Tax=Chironomus riparius TaxID=315576 RepID=A0A9N9SC52_9DIPT|nr:unnamed protein product [Chironomus riparius]
MSGLHMKLCHLILNNNKIFSLQVVLLTGISILNGTSSYFELYMAANGHNDNNKIYYVIAIATAASYFVCGIIFMIYASNLTMNEGEKTLKDIHCRIYLTSVKYDIKIMERVQLFLLQLQHFNANVSCGLFRIDLKIITMLYNVVYIDHDSV